MRYIITTTYEDGHISQGVAYARYAAEYFAEQMRVGVSDGLRAVEVTITAEQCG